ncbi:cysteine--tRNA ligase [Candidatus Dependentiae bacterium]|nr:cysteine--tRNA ligase [Candidatus Dependentiae bacterium]
MKKTPIYYPLTLTNTLTGKQELFVPQNSPQVSLYVCGITPYDYAHIGHGRCYVTFDVLYRLLSFIGYQVTYCRNFTDIDDKLISRAEREYNDAFQYTMIAEKFINAYHQDMQALNCTAPTVEPRVTDHIQHIIDFISGLIEQEVAYATSDGVYYSISSFPAYGKLSKRNLADLQAGARVQIREEKHNPLDFALWKKADAATGPTWQSPWGAGRPGWHIECSAMAQAYLGATLDIHAGGMDLIFPHHENELAQSEGLNHTQFARYWMHNAFVQINKEKMSKSLGNFITLRDIYTRFNPMVLRYYFLNNHYRNPLDFSVEDIEGSAKSYNRLAKIFHTIPVYTGQDLEKLLLVGLPEKLMQAVCDDLNIAKFFGIIFDNLKNIAEPANVIEATVIKTILVEVLGLTLEPLGEKEVVITAEMQQLIRERQNAREAKNWALADSLRDKLKELGYDLQDKKLD